MARIVSNYTANGSTLTDEYGTLFALYDLLGDGGVIKGMQVVANSSPAMNVYVQTGSAAIPTGTAPSNYGYFIKIDTSGQGEKVTIATAAASPRIDYIVAYVNKGQAGSTGVTNNTNDVFLLKSVAGTPASSPVVPTTAQIQSAIGAANPYLILAQVAVGANATQITSPNITDLRTFCAISSNNIGTAAVKASNIDFTTFGTSILGHGTNTTSAVVSTSSGNVTITSTSVTIPTTSQRLKIEGYIPNVSAGGAAIGNAYLWSGTTSGTQLQRFSSKWQDSGDSKAIYLYAIVTSPTAGSATFTMSLAATANNLQTNLSATALATITVSLI